MTTDIQAPYRLVLADTQEQVMALQAYIQSAYSQEFNARIPHFLPCLLGLYRADGILVGACGLKLASTERLYLEQYLDHPIEVAIETRLGAPARRNRIVEVGNLACSEPGNARLMFAALCRLLCDNDLDYVVFTGTARLRNSFHRLHLTPVELAPARADKVGEDASAWGAYYHCQPKVMVGDLGQGRQALAQGSLLLSLLAPMPSLFNCPQRSAL
ncbi:thermostable hemolysin [Aeromonas bestiarum]|uniref:thermostable hemolysin n=1 Tax=Aeromonas bestiarum TaxID=105751 RepID=UPI000CD47951|nr:thermostable hemolysin [Aeromonas bestiarum]POG24261.1 thermostable hemolysin [Aeromonas bestiarum]